MNITDFVYDMINGRKRMKPQMIMLGIIALFAVFVFFFVFAQRQSASGRKKPGPIVMHKAPPPKDLDYQIVKVDTIPFSHPTMPAASPSRSSGSPPTISPQERPAATSRREYVAPPPSSTPLPVGGASDGGSMIVVSSLNQPSSAGTLGSLTGLHTVRLKVILPDRTPVTNGSLVEARVMKDEAWGNIAIPRRSSLLGVCNLQGNRVQIDFREIRIHGVTYTCSGRAYDLKSLPGLPYLPLDAKAKQIVIEELKSAAAGVPIVGRYLNQSDVNPFNDEVTTLDEGLEFYALITNIF
ncbi:MAG: conjugative transposon protein TraM [candidate division KSB1 bacterium]|nr:conjugative transposon protein TraM [candidate division KSB1 bacterium]MDZ7364356.1 conjugative transposon protein TraM [candidate division KSB1 bacterium]MDZ7402728.1 conjugative transposon protein TraM [candidate division KSB1 bacterium]